MTFKFDAANESGTMSFTTFNDDAEKLFRKPASEIWNIKSTGNLEAFRVVQRTLSTKPFFIQVTPTQELAMNSVLLWTLKGIDVGDNEPEAQDLASTRPETCTVNREQFHTSPLMSTAKARGKAPVIADPDNDAPFNTDSAAAFDEAFAEAMQFQEIRLASQAFDTDCFDIANQPASKGIVISEAPTAAAELPTWAKLSRPRSNAKSKEAMIADVDMDTEDEDPVPRKRLHTALFKDTAETDDADTTDSATPSPTDA